ncbi:MAG TPA: cation:proton antiporter [Kiritimatiellia bacterium]|nr:cation:proton antiporter [Kiritimatiellia bacterium]HPS06159.1 cation:proton antiporter [Kiritimatiellia bacterium]
MDTTSFFQDLAVILVAVGLVSAVFMRLGWPKVIGYILAGTAIGKYTFGGSLVINQGSIDVLGQIGVVFLMFTLGLEFSVRKLKKVGHVIFPTALLDMAVMIWAGHFVGTKIFGWGSVQSLFLGAAISDSATTLLAKTISEMGWGSRRFAKYIFGITITEDILCVGVIALLTGLVKSGTMHAGAMAYSLGGLLLFLTGVTVFGLLLVPRLLNRVARLKDDESLLLTMLGVCFLVAFIAAKLDFSLALGAFLVGVMGAESEPLKRIYQQCVPLRTMFSAIFFVTIGLLIDPMQMLAHWQAILTLTAVVIVGKSVNCTVGSLLTGQDIKNALQTGIGLAQIGEFAYLVALIGLTMKAVDRSVYQIAVGVSVLTTLLNPFLLRASDPFADWVERRMPARWKECLATYANWAERFLHSPAPGVTAKAIRFNLTLVLLQLALVAVVFIAAGMLARLDFARLSPLIEANKKTLLWGAASLLTVPNAIFLFFRARALGGVVSDTLVPVKVAETLWAQSFRRVTGLLFAVSGMAALFLESVLLSGTIMPEQGWARALVGVTLLVVGVAGWKRFRRVGVESLETLRGVLTKEVETDPTESAADLLDIHTDKIKVGRESVVRGRSLREINLRARVGASVIGIERRGSTIVNPRAEETLEPDDLVVVLGDDEQIVRARGLLT